MDVVWGILGLVLMAGVYVIAPVGLVAAAHNLVRPALGVRLWTTGGHVPLHHALTDPEVVRRRLHVRTVILALPALVGGPALATLGAIAARAPATGLPLLAAGVAITGAGSLLDRVASRVRRRCRVSQPVLAAYSAVAGLAIVLTAAWLFAFSRQSDYVSAAWSWLVPAAVWLLSAALLANEVRIVATWDRLCASRHQHVEEPTHAESH